MWLEEKWEDLLDFLNSTGGRAIWEHNLCKNVNV